MFQISRNVSRIWATAWGKLLKFTKLNTSFILKLRKLMGFKFSTLSQTTADSEALPLPCCDLATIYVCKAHYYTWETYQYKVYYTIYSNDRSTTLCTMQTLHRSTNCIIVTHPSAATGSNGRNCSQRF